MDFNKILRKNILDMAPYTAARDLVAKGDYIFLDANENPFGTWNRYPDPMQRDPKAMLAAIKGVTPDNMVMGNGSDEIIDLLYRISCNPKQDNVISISPSYGMYFTLANLNDVEFREVLLDDNFEFKPEDLLARVDDNTKMILLCSPNNPTGKSFDPQIILQIVKRFPGIVVVDEAYNDFSPTESLIKYIAQYDNLVISQTFSKAWGLASIRAGVGYMSPELAAIVNKVKMPYNMDGFTQKTIVERLTDLDSFQKTVKLLVSERDRLMDEFSKLDCIEKVFPSDSNFFMVRTARHESWPLADIRTLCPALGKGEEENARIILEFCRIPQGILEMMEKIGYKSRTSFRRNVFTPLLEAGLLIPEYKDKPNSPKQRYRTADSWLKNQL